MYSSALASVVTPRCLLSRLSSSSSFSSRRSNVRMSASAAGGDGAIPAFVGKWKRLSEEGVNVVTYLIAHGATPEKAAERAAAPYEQEWRVTGEEEGEFRILTDPGTGRGVRSIVYPVGRAVYSHNT